ncbi:MAG: hypothetical protein ACE5JH_07375 [Acidobacteriota bacterium]
MSEEPGREPAPPTGRDVIEAARMEIVLDRLRSEQDLGSGLLAGAAGALAGALAWALVSVTMEIRIGWMAVGVGVLAGAGMRTFGKGVDRSFGLAGAALALGGCLLGNLLTVCVLIARELEAPILDVLSGLDPDMVLKLMLGTFTLMDAVFYGIAVYEGYRLSFRRVSEDDIARVMGRPDL